MARCGKDTPDRKASSRYSITMALLLSVRVVPLVLTVSAVVAVPSAWAAQVPTGKEVMVLSHIPGKLGPVRFTHADHATKYKRPDGTPIRCRDLPPHVGGRRARRAPSGHALHPVSRSHGPAGEGVRRKARTLAGRAEAGRGHRPPHGPVPRSVSRVSLEDPGRDPEPGDLQGLPPEGALSRRHPRPVRREALMAPIGAFRREGSAKGGWGRGSCPRSADDSQEKTPASHQYFRILSRIRVAASVKRW